MSSWLQDLFSNLKQVDFFFKSDITSTPIEEYQKTINRSINSNRTLIESDEHLLMPEVDKELWINKANLKGVEETASKIQKIYPDSKLLIVIRNPRKMLISRYNQYVRAGGKIDFDFFFSRVIKNENHKEYFDYRFDSTLTELAKFFDLENVLIINQDNFNSDKTHIIRVLSDFIGSEIPKTAIPEGKVNLSPGAITIRIIRRINCIFVKRKKTDLYPALCIGSFFGYFIWKSVTKLLCLIDTRTNFSQLSKSRLSHEQNKQMTSIFGSQEAILDSFSVGTAKEFIDAKNNKTHNK